MHCAKEGLFIQCIDHLTTSSEKWQIDLLAIGVSAVNQESVTYFCRSSGVIVFRRPNVWMDYYSDLQIFNLSCACVFSYGTWYDFPYFRSIGPKPIVLCSGVCQCGPWSCGKVRAWSGFNKPCASRVIFRWNLRRFPIKLSIGPKPISFFVQYKNITDQNRSGQIRIQSRLRLRVGSEQIRYTDPEHLRIRICAGGQTGTESELVRIRRWTSESSVKRIRYWCLPDLLRC